MRAGTLTLVLRRFEPEPLSVGFLYTGQPPLPLKLRAFLDFAGATASVAGDGFRDQMLCRVDGIPDMRF